MVLKYIGVNFCPPTPDRIKINNQFSTLFNLINKTFYRFPKIGSVLQYAKTKHFIKLATGERHFLNTGLKKLEPSHAGCCFYNWPLPHYYNQGCKDLLWYHSKPTEENRPAPLPTSSLDYLNQHYHSVSAKKRILLIAFCWLSIWVFANLFHWNPKF